VRASQPLKLTLRVTQCHELWHDTPRLGAYCRLAQLSGNIDDWAPVTLPDKPFTASGYQVGNTAIQ